MNSGELRHNDLETAEPGSAEVQFALVIARMIDTVNSSPEDMRQAVYDLARYKLQEQFTHADVNDVKRAQHALETAIRGVEKFSATQQASLPPSPAVSDEGRGAVRYLPSPDVATAAPARPPPPLEMNPQPSAASRPTYSIWLPIKRAAGMLAVLAGLLLAFQERERLALLAQYLPKQAKPVGTQADVKPVAEPVPKPAAAKPTPLRPQDYGIYAVSNDQLSELQLLPGRAPDLRVAVSAAIKVSSQTVLPNGHPKFIVFRRDAASNAADRAEVRIVAKVARDFTPDAAGKKPDESNSTWVIRNVAFPFRSSPIADSPEMYELHSEDPTLELTPGRYALIIRGQSYDFTVPGDIVDPRHCIERVILTSGTLYTDCKKL